MLGQALLTKRMGKTRVIAETGAGQHGVATATAAALLGLECVVYMGEEDTRRQALNVARMRLLGAEVVPVTTGSRTLKDAINEAMRDWVTNVDTTHYLLGTVAGPHPFPMMVRDFQRVIGDEARAQVLERTGRLPDAVAACVGGGSNAIGIFHAFLDDPDVRLVGFEAGGDGIETGRHAAHDHRRRARRAARRASPTCCRTRTARRVESHSISAGLDYPGVGPEHALLKDIGRADVPAGHRRRGDGRVRAAVPHRGHHPGDRVGARPRRCARAWAASWARDAIDPGQPVRPRRQGRRHRRAVVRPVRRAGRVAARRAAVSSRRAVARRSPRTGAALIGYLPVGLPVRGRLGRGAARDGRRRAADIVEVGVCRTATR